MEFKDGWMNLFLPLLTLLGRFALLPSTQLATLFRWFMTETPELAVQWYIGRKSMSMKVTSWSAPDSLATISSLRTWTNRCMMLEMSARNVGIAMRKTWSGFALSSWIFYVFLVLFIKMSWKKGNSQFWFLKQQSVWSLKRCDSTLYKVAATFFDENESDINDDSYSENGEKSCEDRRLEAALEHDAFDWAQAWIISRLLLIRFVTWSQRWK